MKNFETLVRIVDALKLKYEHGGNLTVSFNPQTVNYHTVANELDGLEHYDESEEIKQRCITNNKIVDLQIFPVWSHSSISCYGDNLEDVALVMIERLKTYSEEVKTIVEEILYDMGNLGSLSQA